MTVVDLVREAGTPFLGDLRTSGGYERRPDTFHLSFDPNAEPVAHAVVKAASFVHNTDHDELAPLGSVIDADALEAVIGHGGDADDDVEVTFSYEGLRITVSSDGDIWLRWD